MNKLVFILLLTLIFVSCETTPTEKPDTLPRWLAGCWERVDGPQGTTGKEIWEAPVDGVMHGIGFTLQGTDTVFKELIHMTDSVFKVTGADNPEPVSFAISITSDTSFFASNPAHDFPKHIEYTLKTDSIKARVFADSMEVRFSFVKGC